MAKFAKPAKQAKRAIGKIMGLGLQRHGNKRDGKVHAVRSAINYEQALTHAAEYLKAIGSNHGLMKMTQDEARQYLIDQSVRLAQSSLDTHRRALELILGIKLERIKSEVDTVRSTRTYTKHHPEMVAVAQSERNALATRIALEAGLRAHELFTIRPIVEQAPSGHRRWKADLFRGREDWARYTVVGKGGLCREVRLSPRLASELEKTRLPKPVLVKDRGVIYQRHYDIGGGNAWSKSFTVASQRALGWSNGGHGLRHSYAQARLDDYQSAGYVYHDALAHVAQELGHFSPHTTEVYLR